MYYGYPHYASIITFSVNTWSGRPDSNRHAPASDAGEIKPFLYFPICSGSNTGVEPVSREPQSLMLTITPKAPCCWRIRLELNECLWIFSPTRKMTTYATYPLCCRPGGIRTHNVSMYMFLRHACLASCTTDPFLALNSYIPSTERHPR